MNNSEFSLNPDSNSSRLEILLKALRIVSTESAMADQYPELAMEQYVDLAEEVRVLKSVGETLEADKSED